jgi:ubiquinone biosynthesis UbiH/UbiF/VisC/COQ6 family hydroxylase
VSATRLVVAGGGPVGLAFACACVDADITVVDPATQPPSPRDEYGVRVFALSGGTRSFLRDIGAWERIDAGRIAPVRRMEIFGDGGSRLAFSGRPGMALAWIVEADRLAMALAEQAASLAHVKLLRGSEFDRFESLEAGVRVFLKGTEAIEADLLVGADGPDSRVRAAAGLPEDERAYAETAVVANFETGKEHGEVARQWFRRDGVLAWLPLPGRHISIVWSAPESVGRDLLALEPESLSRRVRDAGGAALGDLRLVSRVAGFPLRQIRVQRTVAPGLALVGDAAHAVHPLAGQGVNLGFQDARVLAEEIAHRSPLERPGDLRLLRRYARARREDVTAMQFVTDGLDRLFASRAPALAWLRNSGLDLVDSQPWMKGALAERAMR